MPLDTLAHLAKDSRRWVVGGSIGTNDNFFEGDTNMSTGGGRGKQKMVAALLAFFLGSLGVHHFYLGSTVAGVICLLTCGGCGLIQIVEFIMLLVMSDADFDAKYNARAPEAMEFVFMKK